MNLDIKDTIVAPATSQGMAAISIIRMSGDKSFSIIKKIFKSKNKELSTLALNRAHGYIKININNSISDIQIIDEVVVHLYQAPHSYTGEDVVEINCHGSPYIVEKILQIIVSYGARIAQNGEFTKRAFLNGKVDLLQAEAIADLIQSRTEKSENLSFDQMTGKLSEHLNFFKKELKDLCAILELDLDFSDEEIVVDRQLIKKKIHTLAKGIQHLISSYNYGKILREGIHLVIIGRPNVGKSSLMNQMLKENRAIVSDIPGTTRDSLEEQINLNGYLIKITDTAGLRTSENFIEKEGVKRTHKIMSLADVFIVLLDGSELLQEEDYAIFKLLKKFKEKEKIIVINKYDLCQRIEKNTVSKNFQHQKYIEISSKTGQGIIELEKKILHCFKNEKEQQYIISKTRHVSALKRTMKQLQHAKKSLDEQLSSEFVSFDLRLALQCIGELTGEVTNEEILREIFKSFCIGK